LLATTKLFNALSRRLQFAVSPWDSFIRLFLNIPLVLTARQHSTFGEIYQQQCLFHITKLETKHKGVSNLLNFALVTTKLEKMAAFGKLKRGSVQIQRAAIKASGKLDTLNSFSMLRKSFTFPKKSTTLILDNSSIQFVC
jgi:hypothetical protein